LEGAFMGDIEYAMLKNEILTILFREAESYQLKLFNKNLAFIYTQQNKAYVMETVFNQDNFLHLTGVEVNKNIGANNFYNLCIASRLRIEDFELRTDCTTELKLSVLDRLINIEHTAKMMGDFNGQRPKLYTEKIVGNIYACIGFVKGKDQFFIPNTSLKEDVRDVVTHANRVIAIYSKGIDDREYNALLYKAKGIELDENMLPRELQGRVRFEKKKNPVSSLETVYKQLQAERDIKPEREEKER
jgi:hypothetical protein